MDTPVYLPSRYLIKGKLFKNNILQLSQPEIICNANISNGRIRHTRAKLIQRKGEKDVLVLRTKKIIPGKYDVLLSPQATIPANEEQFLTLREKMQWLKPKTNTIELTNQVAMQDYCTSVRKSWKGQFFFVEEEKEPDKPGLRSAQSGALHTTIGYWKARTKPATIVMPTGTGKTETMLALLINQRIERLLVVVPNDALRTQIANKFINLGLLKSLGIVGKEAAYPVVGILEHKLRSVSEVEHFFKSCNVIVATMQVINGFDEDMQKQVANLCHSLFIDEAHHITAPTWEKFRKNFTDKIILQFTATPYRNDGRQVDGKIIFDFPLKKAQDEGYFKRINFVSLRVYNTENQDEPIAKVAIAQLKKDIKKGLDHIVMARVNNIERANNVVKIYQQLGRKYEPVVVNSRQTKTERTAALQKLRTRQSRIIVCVDMFGEGFDFPELKIAALHDAHKSLAITIQFTGRFTRTNPNIGDATIIANVANPEIADALRELYADGSDWNSILHNLSEGATEEQKKAAEFLEDFDDLPSEIPIQNILPKMSTVVYQTKCIRWRPDRIKDLIKESDLYAKPTINNKNKVALFITSTRELVEWADTKGVYNTVWDLYLLYWDPTQQLLYINSSDKSSYHAALAKAVVGEDVALVQGEQVFRTLFSINRLILINLGLKPAFSRTTSYTMRVGSDVREGMPEAQVNNTIKVNAFGTGFENGEKISIGCSRRGKIWAHMVADNISEWIEWCKHIGSKLLNNRIKVDQIIENAIIPKKIQARPNLVPLTIEWSEDIFLRAEDVIKFDVAGDVVPFYEVGLELTDNNKQGSLKFKVFTNNKSVEYMIKILKGKVDYLPTGKEVVSIQVRGKKELLSDWMQKAPPTIRFEDGTFLIYNEVYTVKNAGKDSFNRNRIETWDWTGVNLSEESQTYQRNKRSIQYHVLKKIQQKSYADNYDIIFDDDDAYEAADIVALKILGNRLIAHFYHCKYAKEGRAAARIDDLYAVCGQAQKSVLWKSDFKVLMKHMRKREISRNNKYGVSRFEKGDLIKLEEIENKSSFLVPELKVFIVQPGLSKTKATNSQLSLLAVTELYLQETYAVNLGVVSSL
ncbi:MAG: DEAD/DEAH box helicase family protein [Candidatus Daviesbacteria bacterium]|nr:DEAD/DEAH box helicase family protein [Candidatus Daviesbacteria bacterium]